MQSPSHHDDFMDLVNSHQTSLYGYIFAVVQNVHDADDVFQRTLMTLWRRFDEFERGTHFGRWAIKTAKFEILNFARSRRRQRLVFSDAIIAALAEQVDELSKSASEQRQSDSLSDCLTQLHTKDQRLVEMTYAESLSLKDVADSLGRSTQSVCNSLKRIRTALFNCVQQKLTAETQNS